MTPKPGVGPGGRAEKPGMSFSRFKAVCAQHCEDEATTSMPSTEGSTPSPTSSTPSGPLGHLADERPLITLPIEQPPTPAVPQVLNQTISLTG